MEAPDLMELVANKLKEAIKSTRKANRKVSKTLKLLEHESADGWLEGYFNGMC